MMHAATEIKLSTAFLLQMYNAEQDAASWGIPHCPVRTDERVVVDGEVYGVTWTSRGGASQTVKLDAMVTNLSTGHRFGFEGIIRKLLKDSAQYTLPRHGTWRGCGPASLALAELAAPRTGALVFHNPVTGPAIVAVL